MKLAIFNIGQTLVRSDEPQPVQVAKQLEKTLSALIPAMMGDHAFLDKLEKSLAR